MSTARLVWANLRRRPVHTGLVLAAITLAFMLYGLTLGIAEGFRRSALTQQAMVPPSILVAAVAISVVGFGIVLALVANAVAHSVRLRQQELGVLMALGFTPRRILTLLGAEAAAPCVGGAALGLVGAKALFAALAALLPALAPVPSPVYTALILVAAIVIALLIPALGTAFTASRITRFDVATVLRAGAPRATAIGRDLADPRSHVDDPSPRASEKLTFDTALDATWLRQARVATRIGLSTLPQRYKGASLIVGSVALLVGALMIPLSSFDSLRVSLARSADPARVVIRAAGRPSLELTRLPDGIASLAATAPGIARDATGAPLIDAESLRPIAGLIKRNNGKTGYTVLAGVGPQWAAMRPSFRLLSGRMPQPGSREMILGTLARQKFSGLDGDIVRYRDIEWRVVGTFATDDWWDGYLVTSATAVKAASSWLSDSAVRVRLTSPAAFESFRSAVAPMLPPSVIVERETEFYAAFWQMVPRAMVYIVLVLGALFGAGAAVGLMLVMHNSLDERRREIATLRLIGFHPGTVAASVVAEGLLLAVLGALMGVVFAWWVQDGRIFNGAWNVTQVSVTGRSIVYAIGFGILIALMGSLPLTLQTLRLSVLDQLGDLFSMFRTTLARLVGPHVVALGVRIVTVRRW